jgi:hypothetical protein
MSPQRTGITVVNTGAARGTSSLTTRIMRI